MKLKKRSYWELDIGDGASGIAKWFQRKVKSVEGEVPVKIAHQNK